MRTEYEVYASEKPGSQIAILQASFPTREQADTFAETDKVTLKYGGFIAVKTFDIVKELEPRNGA